MCGGVYERNIPNFPRVGQGETTRTEEGVLVLSDKEGFCG